jgi:HK97 family phage major capsid protein
VDVAYRDNATFVMHDLVLAYVRKIRDDSGGSGLGRPIWEPSVQVGVPDSLLGFPVKVNNFMDSTVASTKKTIAFGDFRAALAIRRVNGGQLMTLRERYADYLQIGYFAFERADSVVQDSSAVKLLVQT